MSGLAIYNTEDRHGPIQLHANGQTLWLSQLDMADLFQTSKQNIAKHLKVIYVDGVPQSDSVIDYWLTTAADGKNCRVAR